MKNKILLLAIFLSCCLQAQIKMDWKKAPLNPIPEKYTLNHFHLKGPVKEFNNGSETYFFNDNGFLTKKIDLFKNQTIYEYSKGQLSKIRKAKDSILVKISEGKIMKSFNSNRTLTIYEYNDKKQLIASSNTSEGSEKEQYKYDSKGRLSESKVIYPHITIHTIYTYSEEGEYDKVYAKKNGQTTRNYFQKGYYMGGVLKAKSRSFDLHGNPLSLINQNGQEYKKLKYIYYEN